MNYAYLHHMPCKKSPILVAIAQHTKCEKAVKTPILVAIVRHTKCEKDVYKT